MISSNNKYTSDYDNISNCWSKIIAAKGIDFFVDTFYASLFKHHPEIRSLFPDNLKRQKTSLLSMLNSVVNGSDYIESLNTELTELGKRHDSAGVTKEMYGYFIDTIVEAANLSSDFSFNEKELEAWKKALHKVSDIMLRAY